MKRENRNPHIPVPGYEIYRRAVEASPNGIIMVDRERKITLVNSQTEKLFGYSREELVGKEVELLVPQRFRSKHPGFVQGFFSDPKARAMGAGRDLFGLKKNGTEVPIEIGLNPLTTIEGTFVLASIIDITERKRAEAQTRRLATVTIDSNDAITVQDFEGKITAWNRGAERMYGYTEAEALGMNIGDTVPEEKRAEALAFVEKLKKEEEVPSFETQRLTKDGRILDVWLTVTALRDEMGKPIGIATTERDITERKRAEERLVEEKKNLEKVNLELDSFVYTASHDLRAPLRGLSSYATFLEEDYKGKFDEKGKDYLNGIREAAHRMDELIEGLLTLSRISRIQNPYEDVNFKDLVDSILQRIEFDIRELKVDLRIQENLPVVHCDRIKMGEVWLNLVNNAIKFSSKNNREVPKVEVGYHDKLEAHEFYVKDNGIGIDAQYHTRIFGIFEHLHPTDQYKGVGLGLNIVKRVIEDHGGRVWVESELGKGATFYFTIPRRLKSPKKKLGEILVEDGLVSQEKIKEALEKQEDSNRVNPKIRREP